MRKDLVTCPGCGLMLPDRHLEPPRRCNASGECIGMYHELISRTIALGDGRFIHQHAVDAYAAQHPGGSTQPCTTWFALIGLFLAFERGYSGREVQLAHMKIGKRKRAWPQVEPPAHPGGVTVTGVLGAREDSELEAILMQWAASVWENWAHLHTQVREMTDFLLYEDT